jgi:hypothetical protein
LYRIKWHSLNMHSLMIRSLLGRSNHRQGSSRLQLLQFHGVARTIPQYIGGWFFSGRRGARLRGVGIFGKVVWVLSQSSEHEIIYPTPFNPSYMVTCLKSTHTASCKVSIPIKTSRLGTSVSKVSDQNSGRKFHVTINYRLKCRHSKALKWFKSYFLEYKRNVHDPKQH